MLYLKIRLYLNIFNLKRLCYNFYIILWIYNIIMLYFNRKKCTKFCIKVCAARRQLLTSVILATWEAEIGKIAVQGQPRQIVHKIPSPK
jgi:hypothetical protein